MPIIETPRLVLRPLQPEDAPAMFAYRADPEVNQYQSWVPGTLQDVEKYIRDTSSEFNLPDTWFQLAIVRKEGEKLIGDIGVHFLGPENQQCELGITLDVSIRRKGYAAEALRGIIDYLFTTFQKHRIIASIDPVNDRSIRLFTRLGFQKEAHFRKSLFFKGQWVDDLIYAMLQTDWHSIKEDGGRKNP